MIRIICSRSIFIFRHPPTQQKKIKYHGFAVRSVTETTISEALATHILSLWEQYLWANLPLAGARVVDDIEGQMDD